jgi:tetratricopeptide (TPR) repeat protein
VTRGTPPADRTVGTRLLVPIVLLALALPRCGGPEGPSGPRVVPPDPDLGEMEPQVAELLQHVRQAVVETESAASWGSLGSAYDAHGLLAAAEVCYRRARELDPEAFDWAYLLAVVREIRGAEADEVVALFERAAALDPDYPPIHVRLGAALALRGEHEPARAAFERAVALAPQNAVAHRGLGQVLLALDSVAQAAEHLLRAVELQPQDLSARAGLAQAYMRLGQDERASAMVGSSQGLQPINSFDDRIYGERVFMRSVSSSRAFSRAQAAMRIGAWPQAVQDLALVLRARPDDASTHYWKGTAHQQLGQRQPAMEHLARAVELEPGMVPARLQLAGLLVNEGRHAEAVEHYERSARLRPLDADGHHGLGLAYERAGRPADARAHYEAALQLDPAHAAATSLARLPAR